MPRDVMHAAPDLVSRPTKRTEAVDGSFNVGSGEHSLPRQDEDELVMRELRHHETSLAFFFGFSLTAR